ncbi:hypothetical protein J2S00_000778 [Caldalkalibacillus uzonensis]|uniref:Uncharacterized protein n=1 Tax=Caldalkalibacillus uzonensis TaxID=353224 RepID=A0ABU0CR76_9BACI|nr:hypothetical protein [Caldalkalibacillus uzonensis]
MPRLQGGSSMSKQTAQSNRVLTRADVLFLAFGAMIG